MHEMADDAVAPVLVIVHDDQTRVTIEQTIRDLSVPVTVVTNGIDGVDALSQSVPSMVICDIDLPALNGFGVIERMRRNPRTRRTPLLVVTEPESSLDIAEALALPTADVVTKPCDGADIARRVQTQLARPRPTTDDLVLDRRTGALAPEALQTQLASEHARVARGGSDGIVAVLTFTEPAVINRTSALVRHAISRHVATRTLMIARPLDVVGQVSPGELVVIMPETSPAEAQRRLRAMSQQISAGGVQVKGERYRVGAAIGYAMLASSATAEAALTDARRAAQRAVARRELLPVQWSANHKGSTPDEVSAMFPELDRLSVTNQRRRRWLVTPIQILVGLLVSFALPFIAHWQLDAAGLNATWPVYWIAVATLALGAIFVAVESTAPRRAHTPPDESAIAKPRASALIMARMPDDASTILETIRVFQDVDYPDLEIIVAYSAIEPLPIEAHLAALAARDPNVVPVPVTDEPTNANLVNAALEHASGAFVGVFDADQHPAPDAFSRAWRWLAEGDDVVQGRSIARNGPSSQVARGAAVEHEILQAVHRPAMRRLLSLPLVERTNSYWRTDLLHRVHLEGDLAGVDVALTLRIIDSQGTASADQQLLCSQLAPATRAELWSEHAARTHGWFDFARSNLAAVWRTNGLSAITKMRFAAWVLLREIGPWLAFQIIPVAAYWFWRGDERAQLVPIIAGVTAFFIAIHPLRTLLAYRHAFPKIREHRWWWVAYVVRVTLYYGELKNQVTYALQLARFIPGAQRRAARQTANALARDRAKRARELKQATRKSSSGDQPMLVDLPSGAEGGTAPEAPEDRKSRKKQRRTSNRPEDRRLEANPVLDEHTSPPPPPIEPPPVAAQIDSAHENVSTDSQPGPPPPPPPPRSRNG